MRAIYLRRFDMDDNNCLGVWRQDDIEFPLFTCELPWRHNAMLSSCVPRGVYILKPYLSSKFGQCFSVEQVAGRSEIRVHAGNTFTNTTGCILIGMAAGNLNKEEAVLSSKQALNLLLSKIKEPRELHISECWI